jgi:hypothetical protein
VVLVFTFGLNSESFLNKTASLAIKESGLDIKYKSIKGGLYSGLKIEGFEYEDKISSNLALDMDFKALKDGHLVVNDLNISNLKIKKEFLSSLLKPTDEKSSKSSSENPIKDIDIKRLHLDLSSLLYKEYEVYDLTLDVENLHYDMKESISGDISLNTDTNVAKLIGDISLKDSRYILDLDADLKNDYAYKFLKDTNITLSSLPHIKVKADGDFKDVSFDVALNDAEANINDITLMPKLITAKGDYGIESGELVSDLTIDLDSSVAKLDLKADIKLDKDDINNTLKFHTKSIIKPSKDLINEQNLTIVDMPEVLVDIGGDLKEIKIRSNTNRGEIRYNDITIKPKLLNIDANYFVAKKDISAKIDSLILSNIADIDLMGDLKLNLDDINSTLKYNAISNIKAKNGFLKSKLKDSNITLNELSPLSLDLKGDAKALDAKFLLDGEFSFDELKLRPKIDDSFVHLDLLSKDLNSNLSLKLDTNRGYGDIDAKVSLNLDDINNSLKYQLSSNIKDAKAFKGVDLSHLGDIKIDANGSLKELNADLKSQKIKATLKSSDFDNFTLDLATKRIYISKIYKDVPPDLKKSFVAIRADGSYKLSSKELHLKSKLDGFRYNNHTITTNEFNLDMVGDEITLSPTIIRAGDFKLTTSIKKVGEDLVAKIKNRALNLDAKFRLDPLFIKADGKIRSIDRLLKEINKVYPVDTTLGVDGRVVFKARTQGDRITVDITSPKITLKEGRLEKLDLKAIYQPNRIVLKNFDFDMRGFGDKSMNKKVRLARDGIITFDDENASVDVELLNLVHFKGSKKGDVINGKLTTHKLTLAYQDYGKLTLSSDIDIFQSGDKTAITGEIEFKDTEVNYESRYLDVSKDSDIIIVSDKNKTKDSFKENIFLDLKIFSDDNILYKVRAGEIELRPNIVIRKDFGSNQKITGKIKIMDGMYDLADKRFKIKEGAVAFRGLEDINPLLDLHVEYDEIDDIDIFIDIAGDKNRPKLKFSSKPQKSKKDIFSYLLFGMSASESEGAASSANKAAERIFGRAISKDLARELNLDRLDMNRNNLGGVDIKAGKKVDKKTIIYYQNRATESSVIVERKLSRDWEVTIEAGKAGQGVDFVYRKGFK